MHITCHLEALLLYNSNECTNHPRITIPRTFDNTTIEFKKMLPDESQTINLKYSTSHWLTQILHFQTRLLIEWIQCNRLNYKGRWMNLIEAWFMKAWANVLSQLFKFPRRMELINKVTLKHCFSILGMDDFIKGFTGLKCFLILISISSNKNEGRGGKGRGWMIFIFSIIVFNLK